MRRSGRTKAFTLVEAIAIVIVLGLAVPATVGMLYDATRQRVQTRQNLEADRFASAILETVLADAYNPDAGLGLDAVTDPAYERLIAPRLGGLAEFYKQRGFAYRIGVSGPVGLDADPASGTEYRYVTATVEWMPAGSTTRSRLSAGVLVTDLPRQAGSVFGPPPPGYQVYQTIDANASWKWKRLGWKAVKDSTALQSGRRSRWLLFIMKFPGTATPSQVGLTVMSRGIGRGKKRGGAGAPSLDFVVSVYDSGTRRWRTQNVRIAAISGEWQTAWFDVGNVSGTGYTIVGWRNARKFRRTGLTVAGIQMAGRQ